ncbi:DUF4355 domain-containing protein [Paraliobacillus ryukyuensis]|uniref:DUF4355 domain-containing protein n=1 Tax=Paraliobacillus ryukyuensis TaxID=200904 RepID=UPI0009A6D833|nr:DUF4355 domain-containing protein [Paraliobacillus ryukyuensis]
MEFIKKTIEPLKLNIQFFGGDGGEESVDDNQEAGDDKGSDKTPEQIEFDKQVEAESDRKLASAKKKWEQEQEAKTQQAIKDALAEQQRLSKLSEKEREQEQLTQREKDIAKKEEEIARKQLRSEAIDDLQSKDLPSSFADFLLGEDAEKTLENINAFKTAFDEAVNASVKEQLRQETPKDSVGGSQGNGLNKKKAEMAKNARIIK